VGPRLVGLRLGGRFRHLRRHRPGGPPTRRPRNRPLLRRLRLLRPPLGPLLHRVRRRRPRRGRLLLLPPHRARRLPRLRRRRQHPAGSSRRRRRPRPLLVLLLRLHGEIRPGLLPDPDPRVQTRLRPARSFSRGGSSHHQRHCR